MYIQSKFKDFYDSGSAYGVDKTKVFIRHQESFEIMKHFENKITVDRAYSLYKNLTYKNKYIISRMGLFLCGEIYPVILISQNDSPSRDSEFKLSKDYYIYSKSEIETYQPIIFQETNGELDLYQIKTLFNDKNNVYKILNEINETFSSLSFQKALLDISTETNSAYFLFDFHKTYINLEMIVFHIYSHPNLKEIGVSKFKDPLTLYGQIEQYISNQLRVGEPNMIEISDKDKAAAHGHDGKYSFKKPPEK